jgi:hypothetical protein
MYFESTVKIKFIGSSDVSCWEEDDNGKFFD